MKNKIIHIVSAFLLASMVVPIIVEGVELTRDHNVTESVPTLQQRSRHDMLYFDADALRVYDPQRSGMRFTMPQGQQAQP